METETKPKLDIRKLVITTLLVLLTSAAVGGGVYYVLNSNFQKEREANEKALNDVREQVKALEKKEKETPAATVNNNSSVTTPSTTSIKSFSSQQLADTINAYNSMSSVPKTSKVGTANTGDFGDWISNTSYEDLNKSGKEEFALVTVTSSGSGANKTLFVLGVSNSALRVLCDIGPGGQGHNTFSYSRSSNILDQTYPIYKPGDPNCCPTGGNATDSYVWNGTSFIKH